MRFLRNIEVTSILWWVLGLPFVIFAAVSMGLGELFFTIIQTIVFAILGVAIPVGIYECVRRLRAKIRNEEV